VEINDAPDEELLLELARRGRLTSTRSRTIKSIIEDATQNALESDWCVIPTRGTPQHEQECSRCGEMKDASAFTYYPLRASKSGLLQRINAVCRECTKAHSQELRTAVANAGQIPPKPAKGDVCSHCQRQWSGNWHRHHQGDKFLGWLCGHCNMSFSDHRNKGVL